LAQGTFVLISGRLGAVYGHQNMLMAGGIWFAVLTLVNGFMTDFVAFCLVRALSGIGGALILPNGVAMVGITNPPGSARNLAYGFFGASAPLGGYIGGILVGVFYEYSQLKWCFLTLALATALVLVSLWMLLPPEKPVDRRGKIDWLGAGLGTSALILFNFVWNQAPAVGWAHPYEIAGLVVSIALLASFACREHRVAEPIMPLRIFKSPSFGALLVVVTLNYMSMGSTIWYSLSWLQLVRGWSVLASALSATPFVCAEAT
jgi:MFS family permease